MIIKNKSFYLRTCMFCFNTHINALHTSGTIRATNSFETLNKNIQLAKLSPLARYLKVIASLIVAGTDFLSFVSCLEITGPMALTRNSKSTHDIRVFFKPTQLINFKLF